MKLKKYVMTIQCNDDSTSDPIKVEFDDDDMRRMMVLAEAILEKGIGRPFICMRRYEDE